MPGVTISGPSPRLWRRASASSPEATTPSQPSLDRSPGPRQHQLVDLGLDAHRPQVLLVQAGQHGDGEDLEVPLLAAGRLQDGGAAGVDRGERDRPAAELADGGADGLGDVEELEVGEDLLLPRLPASRSARSSRRRRTARGRPCRTARRRPVCRPGGGPRRRPARRGRRSAALRGEWSCGRGRRGRRFRGASFLETFGNPLSKVLMDVFRPSGAATLAQTLAAAGSPRRRAATRSCRRRSQRPPPPGRSCSTALSWTGSTGLVRWRSKPASLERRRSSSRP